MSLFALLDSPPYVPLDRVSPPQLGQLVWTPVPHLDPQPKVIEADRGDPTNHTAARGRWTTLTDQHFTKQTKARLPILGLGLGETEEILAFKAKRRIAVIVGMRGVKLGDLGADAPPHHEEDRLVVAPIVGIRDEEDPNGFGTVLATRVEYLLYPQYFPVPAHNETRSPRDCAGACSVRPGVARFDRLQFIPRAAPACRLVPLKLSEELLGVMLAMLWTYLHATPSPKLVELKEILAEYLPSEAKPK